MSRQTKKILLAALCIIGVLVWLNTCVTRVYEATVNGHNAPITVAVSIAGKTIRNVEVKSDYETIGVGKKAIEVIPGRIVQEQSLEVDAVSGASVTSAAILYGVEKALEDHNVSDAYLKKTPEKEMPGDETYSADVIVVGGGGAGLAAAVSAQQHGAEVLVLERLDILGGSTNVSEGALNAVDPVRQKAQGIEDSVENFIGQTYHGGHEKGNLTLITYLCENAMKSVEWLESIGMEFRDTIGTATGALFARSHYPKEPSGNSYVRVFEEYAGSHDAIKILTGVEATDLIMEDGQVTGVRGTGKNGRQIIASGKAVILATGGFGANTEMLADYNDGVWAHVDLTELGCTNMRRCADGSGIRMAQAAGAAVTGMSDIQIHPCGTPGTGLMENIRTSGRNRIFVNQAGERFVNEGAARDVLAQTVFDQEDGTYWIVVNKVRYPDRDWKDQNGASIRNMAAQGSVVEADTLEELAEKTGMDPDKLSASVTMYNAVVRGEAEDPFGFRADDPADTELTEGPWYACRKVPTIHHTMGGLVINVNTQVLDENGDPIPGLYAAGEVTGGIHGSNRLGGNAIADVMTFGQRAGEAAADMAKSAGS